MEVKLRQDASVPAVSPAVVRRMWSNPPREIHRPSSVPDCGGAIRPDRSAEVCRGHGVSRAAAPGSDGLGSRRIGADLFGFSGRRGECEACGRCREQQARIAGLAVADEVACLHPAGSGARPGRRTARAICRPALLRPGASAQPRHAAPAQTASCVRGFLTSCANASSQRCTPLVCRSCDFSVLFHVRSVISCGQVNFLVENERSVWLKTNTGLR